ASVSMMPTSARSTEAIRRKSLIVKAYSPSTRPARVSFEGEVVGRKRTISGGLGLARRKDVVEVHEADHAVLVVDQGADEGPDIAGGEVGRGLQGFGRDGEDVADRIDQQSDELAADPHDDDHMALGRLAGRKADAGGHVHH